MEIIKPTFELYNNWNHQFLEVRKYPNVKIRSILGYPDLKGKIINKKLPAKLDWCDSIFKIKFIQQNNWIFDIEIYDSKKYEPSTPIYKKWSDLTIPDQ